jgi:hypothetical protein
LGFAVAIPNLLGLNATWYEIFTEHKLEIEDIKNYRQRIKELMKLIGFWAHQLELRLIMTYLVEIQKLKSFV